MNLLLFYMAFALGTIAGSSFLYSIVIFSQTMDAGKGFSGLVFLFLFLPFPLIFLYTGYLLDRYSKKWILLSFQCLHFLACFSLFYFHTEILVFPYLLILVAITNGMGMTTVLPGRMAILKDIAPTHRVVFHTIVGNLLLIFCFGMSPLLVGALKETYSFQEIFLFLALSHAISIFLTTMLNVEKHITDVKRWNYSEVLYFLQKDKISRQVLYVTILSMLALGPVQVILPKYIRDVLGLGELARGAVLVALGPGLFFGGMLTVFFHHLERKGLLLLVMLIISSVLFLGFVPFYHSFVTSIFLFLFGISGGVLSSLLPAILQKRSDDKIRGRLLSLYTVCFQFTPAVSGFISAFLGDFIGIVPAFLWLGSLVFLASLGSYFTYSELRET
ncbi:MAG: MFS transporter [Leptospira sp.]|nr:MFS transporter [Leptospira sp.]